MDFSPRTFLFASFFFNKKTQLYRHAAERFSLSECSFPRYSSSAQTTISDPLRHSPRYSTSLTGGTRLPPPPPPHTNNKNKHTHRTTLATTNKQKETTTLKPNKQKTSRAIDFQMLKINQQTNNNNKKPTTTTSVADNEHKTKMKLPDSSKSENEKC